MSAPVIGSIGRAALLLVPLLLVTVRCGRPQAQAEPVSLQVRTIGDAPVTRLPVEPSQTLTENIRPAGVAEPGKAAGASRDESEDEGAAGADDLTRKMDLPFAPAIAMDPVDGGKVSITPSTPVADYENKLYYFTSEQNKRAFLANPKTYLTGQLATY